MFRQPPLQISRETNVKSGIALRTQHVHVEHSGEGRMIRPREAKRFTRALKRKKTCFKSAAVARIDSRGARVCGSDGVLAIAKFLSGTFTAEIAEIRQETCSNLTLQPRRYATSIASVSSVVETKHQTSNLRPQTGRGRTQWASRELVRFEVTAV